MASPPNIQCDPLQNNFDVPVGPPLPGLPGFGLDISLDIGMPDLNGFPEDILNWLNRLKFKLPGGGLLQKFVNDLAQSIAKILSSLLGYLNAVMGWLMFALAIVEMILCIIKVLCAAPKPWSIVRAVKRLLRKCLPIFITICFPFLAWLLLLLALIAILLALIEYIINMIKRLIQQIIKNIKRLINLMKNSRFMNAALGIIQKLANLICLFEMIFVFLGVVFAIIDIITGQWSKVLKVCSRGSPKPDGTRGPDDDDVCAEFMRNTVEQTDTDIEIYRTRVGSSNGELWYCNQVYGTPNPLIPAIISQIRAEAVYLQDNALASTLKFNNIISSGGFPFFPFDKVITKDVEYRLKPYFVDLKVTCDPGDGGGSREFEFEDVTVVYVNTIAVPEVIASIQQQVTNANGYLMLSGGEVVNDQPTLGKTIEEILGQKIKAAPPRYGDITQNDGTHQVYTNITYSLRVNFEALAEYNLITMGCFPSVQVEQGVLNAEFDKVLNYSLPDFVTMPDVATAIDDLGACYSAYRAKINEDTTNTFGTCMTNIMNNLQSQASNTYCQLLLAAMDIYNMNMSLLPDMQFTNIPIQISVTPYDKANRTLLDLIGGFTPPQSCLDDLASRFKGTATLGTVSDFSYDGYGNFIADLNSTVAGDGYLTVAFDGNTIKKTIKPDDPSEAPTIEDYTLDYTFVGSYISDGYIPAVRRDESDNT